jgi:hypothetical protein
MHHVEGLVGELRVLPEIVDYKLDVTRFILESIPSVHCDSSQMEEAQARKS